MTKIARMFLLTFLITLVSLSSVAYGQESWEKKPYRDWSKDEALKVITDSPWAQTTSIEVDLEYFPKPTVLPLVTVRLRSALPLRQSIVRLKQLKVKYDKMSAANKAKFDLEVKSLLECSLCTNYYVVSIELAHNVDKKKFEKLSNDESKSNIYLITDNGERRNLSSLMVEGHEIFLFFPRLDEHGRSLVTIDTKSFLVVVDRKKLLKGNLPILVPERARFDVTRLVRGSEILF